MSAKAKTTTTQKSKKGRIKTLNLTRDTIKNLSSREQKKVKGRGGARAGVDMGL